jgi:O-antigen/teichoic acid export membrane protein
VLLGASMGAAGFVLAVTVGDRVLSILYRPEYASGATLLMWLSIGAVFGFASAFLGHGMTTAGYLRAQPPLFFAVNCATALACWVLVPRLGQVGAGVALLVASIVQFALSVAVLRHGLKERSRKARERDGA